MTSKTDSTVDSKALQLDAIRKALPPQVFEKSLLKSFGYLLFDLVMWCAALYSIWTLCHSITWTTMPQWQKAVATIVYWNVAGFFMWCFFVVGHDCGHGTFSDNSLLNDVVGHVVHGSILVPYFPWQLSHRRHHMYHNHVSKDYSHPWYTPERLAHPNEGMARWADNNAWLRLFFPIVGWPLYLWGMPDGSHFIPYASQRLWRESDSNEAMKCVISAVVVIAYAAAIAFAFDYNWHNILYYYVGPFFVFGWWLTAVTYLQHHGPDTVVYDDSNWNFVTSAFETIDRTYGFGIDDLHHNISDGHVVHHLFFTKIPHYNLQRATVALKAYLKSCGKDGLYKHEMTRDFALRTHKYFLAFGHRAHSKVQDKSEAPREIDATKVKGL